MFFFSSPLKYSGWDLKSHEVSSTYFFPDLVGRSVKYSCVWTLDGQVVALFGKVMDLLGGALMGQALRVYSLAQPAILTLPGPQMQCDRLPSCLPYHDGVYPLLKLYASLCPVSPQSVWSSCFYYSRGETVTRVPVHTNTTQTLTQPTLTHTHTHVCQHILTPHTSTYVNVQSHSHHSSALSLGHLLLIL